MQCIAVIQSPGEHIEIGCISGIVEPLNHLGERNGPHVVNESLLDRKFCGGIEGCPGGMYEAKNAAQFAPDQMLERMQRFSRAFRMKKVRDFRIDPLLLIDERDALAEFVN